MPLLLTLSNFDIFIIFINHSQHVLQVNIYDEMFLRKYLRAKLVIVLFVEYFRKKQRK